MMRLLLLTLMCGTLTQARPQDIESVTEMENIVLDDSLEADTESALPKSDIGGIYNKFVKNRYKCRL